MAPSPPTLLDMPETPMKTIISFLEPASVINFAIADKKCYQLIQQTKLNVKSLEVDVEKNQFTIELEFSHRKPEFQWEFLSRAPPKASSSEDDFSSFARDSKRKITNDPWEVCKKAIEWLTALVRFPVTDLRMHGPYFPEIQKVMKFEPLQECKDVFMDFLPKTPGNVSNFKNLQSLRLSASPYDFAWFRPEVLKRCTAKEIKIRMFLWSPETLVSILKTWHEDNENPMKNLEFLEIGSSFELVKDTILASFETKPWNPNEREAYFPKYYESSNFLFCEKEKQEGIDCRNAKDIQRSDGLLASILIEGWKLKLVVWHNRFPKRDGNK